MRRLLALLSLPLSLVLLLGACSDDGDESGDDATESSADDGSDDEAFCAVVEEQLAVATGPDLVAAVPAVEAMADAAPAGLQDVFEQNLDALAPLRDASGEAEAAEIFAEEVAPDAAYTESLVDIQDGIDERCGIDISAAGEPEDGTDPDDG